MLLVCISRINGGTSCLVYLFHAFLHEVHIYACIFSGKQNFENVQISVYYLIWVYITEFLSNIWRISKSFSSGLKRIILCLRRYTYVSITTVCWAFFSTVFYQVSWNSDTFKCSERDSTPLKEKSCKCIWAQQILSHKPHLLVHYHQFLENIVM